MNARDRHLFDFNPKSDQTGSLTLDPTVLHAYEDRCLLKDGRVTFRAATLVHPALNNAPHTLLHSLQINPSPPMRVMLLHIQSLADALSAEALGAHTIEDSVQTMVFCLTGLSQYLKGHKRHASLEAAEALSKVPVVIFEDGSRAPCSHLAKDIEEDIAESARAVPEAYLGLVPLLVILGARQVLATSAPKVRISAENPVAESGLLHFIRNQMDVPTLSDLRIRVHDRTFYTHRLVMCAFCEPLRSKFTFAEGAGGTDPVSDVEMPEWTAIPAFECLLRYLYQGVVCTESGQELEATEATVDLVCGLLRLADFWLLTFVLEWCEAFLVNNDIISIYNVCDLLTHAFNCHANQLTAMCIHFARVQFSVVSKLDAFSLLPNELKATILRDVPDMPSEQCGS